MIMRKLFEIFIFTILNYRYNHISEVLNTTYLHHIFLGKITYYHDTFCKQVPSFI